MFKFFVYRPVFAWVISIIIMLFGIISLQSLPIAQYPNIAPPTIRINAQYTGANAETLENSVTQILEQQLTGLDGLLYFDSSSSSNGSVSINVSFSQDTDPDTAQVQVQNKVQQALNRLPSEVQSQGVTVSKSDSSFLLIMSLYDENNISNNTDISDYLISNIQDPLSRINGVGSVQVFGGEHAIRIWLDPQKLKSYNLIPSDIISKIKEQNAQISVGKIGEEPAPNNQMITATVRAQSQLKNVSEFENIIIKSSNNGSIVKLKDVAKVELGSSSYANEVKLNGHPASGVAIMLAPNANALNTSEAVKHKIDELKKDFPEGYKVAYPKDITGFIKISIHEVIETLIIAVILVVLVMYLFLQNFRSTIIPAITVPVVLLGTFGVLSLFGYSINTLTLFGMVLAIGLLVDDAIVVVENVERIMTTEGKSAKEATAQSMQEISGALIAVAAVLSAVFLPMAFFGGSTGMIYKQFSVTIVSAMILSVIVALTLTPALCGSFLKHSNKHHRGLFKAFNKFYEKSEIKYLNFVMRSLNKKSIFMIFYVIIVVVVIGLFHKSSTGFIPNEDQGDMMIMFTLPASASLSRTNEVSQQIEQYLMSKEKNNINYIFTVSGFNFSGSGSNAGMAFIALKDWDHRKGEANSAQSIANRAMKNLNSIKDAQVYALVPPAIMGLGQSNGFTFELQAAPGTDRNKLTELKNQLLQKANQSPILSGVRGNSLPDNPQVQIDIDNQKASALGLSLSDVRSTMSYAFGGSYVNDFLDNNRVKKVYVQGDEKFRMKPDDIYQWYVRSNNNEMTPFNSFAKTYWTYGPDSLSRFNGESSFEIQGDASQGYSSGQAMEEIKKIANELPAGSTYSWSGISYQQQMAGSNSMALYAISIIVVFLCLAALYESWSIPISVIMVIPLGVLGAILAITIRGLDNDVYFQVALLTTIGLSSKNAILIVEFAELALKNGSSLMDSIKLAAKERLRPILMTSFAFMAGILPLAIATGAGANSRIAIGTGILGGTFAGTILSIFFVPIFFYIVKFISIKKNKN